MVRKSVVDYINRMLQQGYDISKIRNAMLEYGYSNKDIEDAVKEVYYPTVRHEIHLSGATIFVVLFVIFFLAGSAFFYFYYLQASPTQLLDLNLEPVNTEARPGENIIFIKELSNLGSSKRYDVVIRQQIIDSKTSVAIIEKTETRAIETFGSTQTQMQIPSGTKPGDYILKTIVEYDGKQAVATLPIKITAPKNVIPQPAKETCFDGIKNQNEEEIDCGGVCKPCENQLQKIDCNDNDPCTEDSAENGQCVHNPIPSCKASIVIPAEQPSLDNIKETAKTDPSKALQLCNQYEVPDLKNTCIRNIAEVQRNANYCAKIADQKIKDLCNSNIAQSLNENPLCDSVVSDGIRDSCYANFFVPPNKDYSVCSKITNNNLRQSCEYLRQLDAIKQQQSQQNPPLDDNGEAAAQ